MHPIHTNYLTADKTEYIYIYNVFEFIYSSAVLHSQIKKI